MAQELLDQINVELATRNLRPLRKLGDDSEGDVEIVLVDVHFHMD